MEQIRIETGVKEFEFVDQNNHVFSAFKVNPTDINLAVRAAEVGELMQGMATDNLTVEQTAELNREVEEQIAHVLGVDRDSVFGEISATTIFPDGTMFAQIVLDKIIETVEPALKERQAKMQAAADKYLGKYKNETESV